LPALSTN